MRTKQWATVAGPRTERAIVQVLDHRIGPRQVPLPFGVDIVDEEMGARDGDVPPGDLGIGEAENDHPDV